jgi:hypothetical protein
MQYGEEVLVFIRKLLPLPQAIRPEHNTKLDGKTLQSVLNLQRWAISGFSICTE